MSMQTRIQQDFWQGTLKLYILAQVEKCPSYGSKIKKQLQELGYKISPGTLYPLLHNLEKSGLCKSRIRIFKGRVRKYYEIAPQGKVVLEEMRTKLAAVVKFLLPQPAGPAENNGITENKEFPTDTVI